MYISRFKSFRTRKTNHSTSFNSRQISQPKDAFSIFTNINSYIIRVQIFLNIKNSDSVMAPVACQQRAVPYSVDAPIADRTPPANAFKNKKTLVT